MRKLIITICFCLITSLSFADKYYVFIEKNGYVEKGQEAGHNEEGDVIAATPYTKQYKPTSAELTHFKVIVLDLTEQEREDLLEPEIEIVDKKEVVIRARKRKIDINKLTSIKQEEVINDKTIVLNELSVKPLLISK